MKKLGKLLTMLVALGLGASLVSSDGVALADDDRYSRQNVAWSDVPERVRDTIEQKAKGGWVDKLHERTYENGKTVYALEVVKTGQVTEYCISPDGSVLRQGTPDYERAERRHHHQRHHQHD